MNAQNSQMLLPSMATDKASFDNFWAAGNEELVSALTNIGNQAERKPVYFYGRNGSGKSHLLNAVVHKNAKKSSQKSDAAGLSSTYLLLSDARVVPEMLDAINAAQIVCLDDVHTWAGNRGNEEALFALFERVKHADGQIVLSAARPPEKQGFVLLDLVSRFRSGSVYPLYELCDERLHGAIKMRAKHRGFVISDDAIRYMLTRLPRETQVVFDFLDKIDRVSLSEHRKMTIPFLQELIRNE